MGLNKNKLAKQLEELANFLMKEYADEMGNPENPTSEGAIEMAIRLLKKLKPKK